MVLLAHIYRNPMS
ncbi:hypothetical protein F383_07257 [Gossypium arboreum]|nr:hypothetical protein F383_10073 [Gossypium arboreum]KHG25881.1 hypothetical protein F383_07257 [Gossypium arboreum]